MPKFVFPLSEEAAVSDSKKTFEEFYRENYSGVFFYLLNKIGNRENAEDLAGECFLYAYEHYASFDPSLSSEKTWLYLITNSRLKNFYRDRKETQDISDFENYLFSQDADMEKAVFLEQLKTTLNKAIEKLPERQKKIIMLRYFDSLDFDAIAAVVGTTPGNIRVILSRSLVKLKEYCVQLGLQFEI